MWIPVAVFSEVYADGGIFHQIVVGEITFLSTTDGIREILHDPQESQIIIGVGNRIHDPMGPWPINLFVVT